MAPRCDRNPTLLLWHRIVSPVAGPGLLQALLHILALEVESMAQARNHRESQDLYPPYPVGSRSTQSLGRVVDNLTGDRRHRRRAQQKAVEIERILRNGSICRRSAEA